MKREHLTNNYLSRVFREATMICLNERRGVADSHVLLHDRSIERRRERRGLSGTPACTFPDSDRIHTMLKAECEKRSR